MKKSKESVVRIARVPGLDVHVISKTGESVRKKIAEYIADQAGAMAVDWFCLTAGLVLVAGAAYPKLHEATLGEASKITAGMEAYSEVPCMVEKQDEGAVNEDRCLRVYQRWEHAHSIVMKTDA